MPRAAKSRGSTTASTSSANSDRPRGCRFHRPCDACAPAIAVCIHERAGTSGPFHISAVSYLLLTLSLARVGAASTQGLPSQSYQRNRLLQNALGGKRQAGLRFHPLDAGRHSRPRHTISRRSIAATGGGICQRFQNFMTKPQTLVTSEQTDVGACRTTFVLQGSDAVLFCVCRWATCGFQ